MVNNLSARIKDEHIQKTVKQNLKKRAGSWRWIWPVLILALAGSLGYFGYRFSLYGEAKAADLVTQGQAALEQANYSQALDDFNQALLFKLVAKKPAAAAAFEAARIESLANDAAAAQNYLQQAIALQPDNVTYRATLVKSLIESADLSGARDALTELTSISDEDGQVLMVQALLELAQNQPEQARVNLEKAVLAQNIDPRADYLLAALVVHDDPERTITILEELAISDEKISQKSKYQKLLGLARQIRSKINNDAYEYVLVGLALERGQEPYAALSQFKKALSLEPAYRDAWIYRANAEIDVKQLSAAEDSIGRAIKSDPTYGFSRFVEGRLQTQKKQWQAAITAYRQTLDLGYQKVDSYLALARAQVSANLKDEAADTLKQALKNDQIDHRLIYEEFFWLYFDRHDYGQARRWAEAYGQDFIDSDEPKGLKGLALFFLGQKDEAEQIAKQVLVAYPDNAAALLTQGLILRDLNVVRRAADRDRTGHLDDIAEKALHSADFTK